MSDRLAGLLSLAFVLLSCGAALAEVAEARVQVSRLPLGVIEAQRTGSSSAPQPLLTIGCLPPERQLQPRSIYDAFNAANFESEMSPYRLPLGEAPLIDAIRSGKVKLGAAHAGAPVVLLLTLQGCDSYTSKLPVALRRANTTLILELEHWFDRGPRDKNVPTEYCYLLSLGTLEAGEYQLNLFERSLFRDTAANRANYSHHKHIATNGAGATFTVAAKDAGGEPTVLPSAQWSTHKTREDAQYESPRYYARRFRSPQKALSELGMSVGQIEAASLRDVKADSLKILPALQALQPGQSLFARVVGPELNSGEWMALRHIIWNDKSVTLQVELWRDNGERIKNFTFFPMLLLPLSPPQEWDQLNKRPVPVVGEYTVNLEWVQLWAPAPGGLYRTSEAKEVNGLEKVPVKCTLNIAPSPLTGKAAASSPSGGAAKDDF